MIATLAVGAPNPDDIRNFGAVCDSTSSQTVNNSAISSALSTNGAAFIPGCSIYVSNVTAPNGARIYGLGASSKLVAYGAVSANGLLNCSSCSDGFDVDRVSIVVSATQRSSGVSGIACTGGCGSVHITNNVVQGNYGILLTNASGAFVENNRITAYGEASGSNISGAGIAVQGTTTDSRGYNCGGVTGGSVVVRNNVVFGAFSSATPVGIFYCNHNDGAVTGNVLTSPGYFGIVARGPYVARLIIDGNRINNSVHEGIIVASGARMVSVSGNTVDFGFSSIDYGITVDGSEGAVSQVTVEGNQLRNSYASGIVLADGAIQFSTVLSNSIVNGNSIGASFGAGISAWGPSVQFNTVWGNSITNTGARPGYLILEQGDANGAVPSHNVYVGNAGFNAATGTWSATGLGSISSHNVEFQ